MRWLKNLKIQNKLFLAFGVIMLLLFSYVLFTVRQFSNANASYNKAVIRQNNLNTALGTLALLRFNNLATAMTYYDDEVSDSIKGLRSIDYESLCNTFLHCISGNREIVLKDVSLSPEHRETSLNALYRIEFLFNDRFTKVFYLIKEGADTKTSSMIAGAMADAFTSASEITSLLNELYSLALDTMEARAGDVVYNKIIFSLFAVALCLMVIALIVAVYMSKMVTLPITDMEKAMVEISNGNLGYPIRSVYKDELGILSNRIGNMVDGIFELNKAVAAIDYLDTMIYVTDMDYNLIYINSSLSNEFGIDHNKYKMKKCYKALRNRDYPCEICHMPQLMHEKENFPSLDYHDVWDGTLNTWIGGRASIIRWTDGNIVHYQTINDEAHKKEYEENLQKAAIEAKAASISKSAFLANMSHEIRTPMNSIVGFSELALDDDGVSEKTKDYLQKIMLNSELLLQIINDILDISKIESGKMELEKIPFNIHELFTACRTIITPKADEKGVNLHFYAEPSIGKKLLGDPVRLRQVLLNILSNAVKFTNTGGLVKISATVSGMPNGNVTIEFEVKDSGIGMSPEQISRVFEPFMQADVGTTRKYGGTGLGLPISKNIIEMMGSTLNVESTLGIGSRFSFEVTFETIEAKREDSIQENVQETAQETAQEAVKGVPEVINKPHFKGEILICEDNEMNHRMLCDHLGRVGLDADVAENGKEGLNMVKRRINKGQKPYDLIFMDIHMPVMDGIEAASKIQELGTGTPIVALTANIMTHDRGLYLKNGMKDYVGKPFVSQELWRCLLKYLKPVKDIDEGDIKK